MADLRDSQPWLIAAALLAAGWLVWLLAPILTPFVASALLAYLGDPLVDRLQKWKLNRTLAVCVVFLLMVLIVLGIVLLLIPLIQSQVSRFIENLPGYIAWLQHSLIPWLEAQFGISPELLDTQRLVEALREHWQKAGGIAASVVSYVSSSGFAIIGWFMNLLLIPVVTFYLMRDWDDLVEAIRGLLPRRNEPAISRMARESNDVLGAFLRGQLSVMVALGIVYSVGLWIVGLNLAFLIGLTAGLVSFVPYLGAIVGVLAAVVAALVQFQDFIHVIFVLIVFGIGQVLESMVLTPWLVGDRIGLHPVAVIFAVLAGGQLFGFVGVLLALPAASVVMVLIRHAHRHYKDSRWYRGKGAESEE